MDIDLTSLKVAILVTNGFQQDELIGPKEALDSAGAKTMIVSPAQGQVRGWKTSGWSEFFPVDVPLQDADENEFDALLLPGGKMNLESLQADEKAIAFVRSFVESSKPIGAVSQGPLLLFKANAVAGRRLTSEPSLQADLSNAGGKWVDEEVVIDRDLVTSRRPDDLHAFDRAITKVLLEHKQKSGYSLHTD